MLNLGLHAVEYTLHSYYQVRVVGRNRIDRLHYYFFFVPRSSLSISIKTIMSMIFIQRYATVLTDAHFSTHG